MKKLLIVALYSISLYAMDYKESSAFIRALVDGKAQVNDNETIAFPGASRTYTLEECRAGMANHGIELKKDEMAVGSQDEWATGMAQFFDNADIGTLESTFEKRCSNQPLSQAEQRMDQLMQQSVGPKLLEKAVANQQNPNTVLVQHLQTVAHKRGAMLRGLLSTDIALLKEGLKGPLHIDKID